MELTVEVILGETKPPKPLMLPVDGFDWCVGAPCAGFGSKKLPPLRPEKAEDLDNLFSGGAGPLADRVPKPENGSTDLAGLFSGAGAAAPTMFKLLKASLKPPTEDICPIPVGEGNAPMPPDDASEVLCCWGLGAVA